MNTAITTSYEAENFIWSVERSIIKWTNALNTLRTGEADLRF